MPSSSVESSLKALFSKLIFSAAFVTVSHLLEKAFVRAGDVLTAALLGVPALAAVQTGCIRRKRFVLSVRVCTCVCSSLCAYRNVCTPF